MRPTSFWMKHFGILGLPASIRSRALFTCLLTAMLFLAGSRAWAQESISQEEPTPSSATDEVTSIDRSFVEKPAPAVLFPRLKEELKNTPPFFRDTDLDLKIRSYYFHENKFNDSNSEAWALGGAISYKSGWLLDRFAAGAVLYTSQPLYAPDDRDGTDLLQQGQKGYTVVGQLYGRVKLFEDHYLNLYRYEYNTPYLNKDDSRMTPKTFEGYTLIGALKGTGTDAWTVRYGGGYLTKMKDRTSENFVWMSRAAGANADRGVVAEGALFSYRGFSIGAFDYYSPDIINIGYAEVKYAWPVTDKLAVLGAAQFTDQRSVGGDLLTGSSFETRQEGVKTSLSYAGAILNLLFTANGDGTNMREPWSSYPGYTAAMVENFDQAGENAFGAKVSYDFRGIGLEGVTAYALFVHGWGQVNPSSGPNQDELDTDLQWRPLSHFPKGLWLRGRYAIVHQNESPGNYIHELRVILNYEIPLL